MSQNCAHIHEVQASVGARVLPAILSAIPCVDPGYRLAATRTDFGCGGAARGAGLCAFDVGAAGCAGGEGAALVELNERVA
jgi:hypothetical protein